MARLIDIQPGGGQRLALTLNVGDVIVAGASGVRVRSGAEAVEIVGPLVPGTLAGDQILSPAGAPNTVLVVARKAGRSTVELVIGDPWHAPQRASLELSVEPLP
jgi:hypothetical protein